MANGLGKSANGDGLFGDRLAERASKLSLGVNAGRNGDATSKSAYRESTMKSADDAAGIFDLYGTARDSWEPGSAGTTRLSSQRPARPNGTSRLDFIPPPPSENGMERLDDDAPTSPTSWSGPLALDNGSSAHAQRGSVVSMGDRAPLPDITVTADNTPTKRDRDRMTRESTISSSTSMSTTNSPLHPSMSRLSPRPTQTGDGGGGGEFSGNTSQISFGSSQYPGEEADAFHVRSTYARLEAEGVHGDGWDPGVERTRGGPSQGKRATVLEASKGNDVGEAERGYLTRLDRYGFVSEPLRDRSESRLALIPSAPLQKIPKLPKTSPLAGQSREHPVMAGPGGEGPTPRAPDARSEHGHREESARKAKEQERVDKWLGMMSVKRRDQGGNIAEWGWRRDMQAKVVKRVYKGIPDRWRMAAWWTMAEEQTREAVGKGKGKQKAPDHLGQDYHRAIDQASTFDVQIDLDVPRTISGHTMFVTRYGAGQRSLFHVLHCFSMLCETCGYVQGMGPIAATLLCYFDPEMRMAIHLSRELILQRVYALLVRLHDVYDMHSIFAPGFPGLLEAFYVQERLMEWLMPEVFRSFSRNMISSSAWGTKWYITLFVNTVPFSQQLRIWDAFWLDGRDVMIMTAVAILWSLRDLLSAPSATFESILSLLSSYFVAEDDDHLMRWIPKMLHSPGMRERIDKWRGEWNDLVIQGKTDGLLL